MLVLTPSGIAFATNLGSPAMAAEALALLVVSSLRSRGALASCCPLLNPCRTGFLLSAMLERRRLWKSLSANYCTSKCAEALALAALLGLAPRMRVMRDGLVLSLVLRSCVGECLGLSIRRSVGIALT